MVNMDNEPLKAALPLSNKLNFINMKRAILLLMGAFVVIGTLYAHQPFISSPAFLWNETTHDFGRIKQGVPVSHEFTFTNSGGSDLIITSVNASCGCTVAEYTKTPIRPGEKGFVKAIYNAAKTGNFTKTITVGSNTEEDVVQLTIKAEVVNEKDVL